MKPLTAKQRREIYLKVAEYVNESNWDVGLCWLLLDVTGISELKRVSSHSVVAVQSIHALELFPEFALFKPDNYVKYSLWWKDNSECNMIDVRIICMLLCAEMTKK